MKGYLGYGVKGEGLEPAFRCSELDRVLTVTADGRYKVIPPPEKLFVDRDLYHFALFARDQRLHARVLDAFGDVPEAVHLRRHDPQQGIPLRARQGEDPPADRRAAGARLHQVQAVQARQARRRGQGRQPARRADRRIGRTCPCRRPSNSARCSATRRWIGSRRPARAAGTSRAARRWVRCSIETADLPKCRRRV